MQGKSLWIFSLGVQLHYAINHNNLNDDNYQLKYTAYAALIDGTAVCQGYAVLFYRMALELNVDARVIAGLGNGGAHGWNIVCLNGLYYNADSTWDASRMQSELEYSYFLKCNDDFGDHIRNDEYDTTEFNTLYKMADKNYQLSGVEIITQPESTAVAIGDVVILNVEASGDELSYQWYYRKAGKINFTKWKERTDHSVSFQMINSYDGMELYCRVEDSNGNVLNSDIVTVSISNKLVITVQPENKIVAVGNIASFETLANKENVTYQWYYQKSGASKWTKWNGKTENELTFKMSDSYSNMQVRCVITDDTGNSLTSDSATVIAFTITTQPEDKVAVINKSVSFTIAANKENVTYQWYYKKTGKTNYTKWSGKTEDTLSFKMQSAYDGMVVRCVILDENGNKLISKDAVVTAYAITIQPEDASAAVGDTVTLCIEARGSDLTYQWYYKKSGASKWTKWSGKDECSVSFKMSKSYDGMQVRCVVTDGDGNKLTSDSANVTLAS